jgi:hypothetical protein
MVEAPASEISQLVDEFIDQVAILSTTAQVTRTSTYKDLLARGHAAVPDLLKALDRAAAGDHSVPAIPIMIALSHIVGKSPVTSDEQGDVPAMIQAWLKDRHALND